MTITTTAILRRQQIATQFTGGIAIAFLAIAAVFVAPTVLRAAPPVPGAIWTTDPLCTGVDLNIYGSKGDVSLNGGPAHGTALPPGDYYVQVTDPNGGCVLGTSVGASLQTPFHVNADGSTNCIQLCTALINGLTTCYVNQVADSGCGYNDTGNPGGEYKVWVSMDPTFPNNSSKTDNFKVREGGGGPGNTAQICVSKFYDANANGVQDGNEQFIAGWEYTIQETDNLTISRETDNGEHCSTVDVVAGDQYTITESTPVEQNWFHTTTNPVVINDIAAGQTRHVTFGNVCIGSRFANAKTLGFWSNKNGQNLEIAADFTALNVLCLRTANGGDQDFNSTLSANKTALANWLLAANATNMAYMLSAQLATMKLNVTHGFVPGSALVYAGTCGGLNGFITINDLIAAANAALCADGYTPAGDPNRATQECLKTALDNANNNQNFVETSPCPFSFPTN